MTDVAAAPGETFSIERVIKETVGICQRNIVTLLLLTLIFFGVMVATFAIGALLAGGAALAGAMTGNWAAFGPAILIVAIVAVAAGALFQGASIQVAIDDLNRRPASVGAAIRRAVDHLWPLIGIGILAGLGIGLGFVLFVVPGLILMTMWAVVVPVRMVENTAIGAAFGRSAQLTKGSRWSIFGVIILYMIVNMAFQWALNAALGQAVGFIGSVLLSLPAPVGIAVIYMELRRIKGEATPESLAAVFD